MEYKKGRYSDEEIEIIKSMVDECSISEIANKLNRNYGSTKDKIRLLGLRATSKKSMTYAYSVGQIVNEGLKIVELTRNNQNGRAYIVKSLAYPNDKNDYMITEDSLKRGTKDAYITGNRVCAETSLYNEMQVRPYLIDVEASKSIAKYSNTPINFKCPDCDKIKELRPYTLMNHGFACPNCSKGISYGQLCYYAYDKYFELGFENEVVLRNLSNRRIDFLNLNTRQMVEIQGMGHYEQVSNWDLAATQQADKEKEEYCKAKGLEFIALDMRYSTWEQFKSSINNCPSLPNITTEDENKILEIMEVNKRYNTKEIIELYTIEMESSVAIGKQFNCSDVTIIKILRQNNIPIRRGGIPKGKPMLKNRKRVKCIDNNIIFNSITEATEWAGLKSEGGISSVCNPSSNRQSAGGYHWEYVE